MSFIWTEIGNVETYFAVSPRIQCCKYKCPVIYAHCLLRLSKHKINSGGCPQNPASSASASSKLPGTVAACPSLSLQEHRQPRAQEEQNKASTGILHRILKVESCGKQFV